MLSLACKNCETKGDHLEQFVTVDLDYMNALEISEESVFNAIKVIQYFRHTGLKVIQRLENPAKSLKRFQQIWYDSLPETCTSKEAIEIGDEITNDNPAAKLSRRTVCNLLNDSRLFSKRGRGEYEKNYLT